MVRPMAQKMYDAVILDNPSMLTATCIADYGLDTGDFQGKFNALQNAARKGATVEDFDTVLGSGEELTSLVQIFGSDVEFKDTMWDKLDEFK